MSTVFAIIAAAGSSQRMNTTQSKVSLTLRGKTVLEHAVAPFVSLSIPVTVMVRESDREAIRDLMAPFPAVSVVPGGMTRGESVARGLAFIEKHSAPDPEAVVLVHDAARCLVTAELIQMVIDATRLTGAAVPALVVNDTLKHVNEATIVHTVDRSGLYSVQTPQGFKFELLQQAYREGNLAATDDAGLVEKIAPVSVVEGCPFNIKLTRALDIELAELFLSMREKGNCG